ncbi:hypothetical protein QTI66_34490 [Variovorax sp. J22R133]|uniref:hypothetical protein n=1 Tax=Variovorax brevis TaxID=3053503 RepID=UPI002574D306|nr:hypothetical protein [Variovorax sp. J22R133]MDM0117231.1 hypothetical protein [Variovorax sp. J22R133]
MSRDALTILHAGLVTSVGLSAAASCAAFRAKLTNPTRTHFMNARGEWIMAHQVLLAQPWRGIVKLAKMAAMAIAEALEGVPQGQWERIPLILCVAESDRPGRTSGLDEELLLRIQEELGTDFARGSCIVAQGRVGVAIALARARELKRASNAPRVLVAAVDSLLSWSTLSQYEQRDRLLSDDNSNGFMPGEAAGALLIDTAQAHPGGLQCRGIGFGHEPAPIDSKEPLRGEGLAQAIKAALADAGSLMHDCDFRITDISGEQYYFKEAALALSRTLRQRKAEFDIWHPAECTGETGAAVGAAIMAEAIFACEKRYARGPNILVHLSNDSGHRAALCLQYTERT